MPVKKILFVFMAACIMGCFKLTAQCTINTSNTTPGITTSNPDDTMTQGNLYAQTFQIYIPATYQGTGIDSVRLAVNGAPQGLTVIYLPTTTGGALIAGGSRGVICFSGVTYDAVGAYPLTFSGTVYMGTNTVPLSSLPANFSYTFYVKAPGPQGYICDTAMNLNVLYDNPVYIPLNFPAQGYLSGNGAVYFGGSYYPFRAVAEKLTGGIGDTVTGAMVEFGRVAINPGDSGKRIGIYVYDATGPLATGAQTGGPGVALDSAFLTLGGIAADVTSNAFSSVTFTQGAALSASTFFIVVALPETTGDTIVIYSNDASTNNGEGYLDITAWYPYTAAAGLSADSLGNFIGATVCGYVPNAPEPGFDALPASICVGTDVQFNNVTLGTPSSFSWSFGDGTPGSSLLNPSHVYADTGTYLASLTASNAGGSITFSHYLKVHANPVVSGTVTNATGISAMDGGVVLTVTGGKRPYVFNWSTGTHGDTLLNVAPATYEVTITDSNSCVVRDTFAVSYVNGLNVLSLDGLIKVYPNPASNVLFVESKGAAITKLEVVNVSGQTVAASVVNSSFYQMETTGLAPGNYVLRVFTANGLVSKLFAVVKE
jgi:PKD repeat protein